MFPALHVPTLLLVTALVVAVAGLLLAVQGERGNPSRAFVLWGASMLVGATGLSLLALAPEFGHWTEVAGAASIVAGTGLSWSAARRFGRHRAAHGLLLLGPAVYLASAVGREPSSLVPFATALLAGGLYTLAAAWELWRSRLTAMRARDAAMVLMALHGLLHLGRGLSLALTPLLPAVANPAISAALMLEALLHTVAMALLLLAMLKEQSQADVLEEAHRLALIDGLTGLGNRRHFDLAIERETARALRDRRPLALLMVDADHFKRINDLFGHLAGDDCLRAVAGAIRSALHRPGDLVCRFGGEEFAVVLPGTDEPGAEAVAAAIHAAVARLGLTHPESKTGLVTVSIGYAVQMPGRAGARSGLLRAADGALYAAKALGRNRTEAAAAVLTTPNS